MEEALMALLLADPDVQSVVGSRVRPMIRPQGSELPAIAVQRIDGQRSYTMAGPDGLQSSRVQIDAWGTTYAAAKTSGRAALDALSGYRGTTAGVTFGGMFVVDEADEYESTDVGGLYRTRLDVIIWHSEGD